MFDLNFVLNGFGRLLFLAITIMFCFYVILGTDLMSALRIGLAGFVFLSSQALTRILK